VIEDWRIELAKSIAKNNPTLSVYNLNIAVQKIIDRKEKNSCKTNI
jgi:hypothetical protein